MFKHQQKMSLEDLVAHARALGLDVVRFRKEVEEKIHDKAIEDDVALARRLKVQGTPNFFINGRHFTGSMSATMLEQVVKEELSNAQQLVRQGVQPGRLYQELTRKPAPKDKQAGPKALEGQGSAAAKGEGQAARPQPHAAPRVIRKAP